MNRSMHNTDSATNDSKHNPTAARRVKSRLPMSRLFEVRAMNTRAGALRYAEGFGRDVPDLRPRAQVIQMVRR